MRKNTVTDLLRAESRPRPTDLTFVVSVMQAVEKRRYYTRMARLCVAGLTAVLTLAISGQLIETVTTSLLPAAPALAVTLTGLFALYVLQKRFGLLQ